MSTESSLRADIVEVGRRMYARGYTASNDGNISVRYGVDRLLMTPKSVCKGFMSPDMMCVTDLEGRKLQGDRDPSTEMLMHLEVYRQRPDVQAVVHAHPPIATGFAVAGMLCRVAPHPSSEGSSPLLGLSSLPPQPQTEDARAVPTDVHHVRGRARDLCRHVLRRPLPRAEKPHARKGHAVRMRQ